MDYDNLTATYRDTQVKRVQVVLSKIQEQPQAAMPGRVVPEPDELAIGKGKSLTAAVMFTDISGFSKRSSGTSAEQNLLLNILNLYFSEMIKVAEEYVGTVKKNT